MRRNPRRLLLPLEEKSVIEAITIMSDGKPASLSILGDLLSNLGTFKFMYTIQVLDSLGIYGSNLLRIFYDKSEGDFQKFLEFVNLLNTNVLTIGQTRNYNILLKI